MADAIQTYDNKVIENALTDLVNTKLDVNSLMTVDTTLTTSAGLTKTVNKYTYNGKVEKLGKGQKNAQKGAVSFTSTDYTVNRYQQTFTYNDMDAMKDPYIVDCLVQGAATEMANQIKTEYFAEIAKVSNKVNVSGPLSYDAVVDALASIGCEAEEGTFILCGTDGKADLRKDQDFTSAHQGDIVFTGQIGTVAGVPVVFSKLVPAGKAYVSKPSAVKFFVKNAGTVEQAREIESKDNTCVYERHGVICLVDDSESVAITFTAAAGE